MGVEDILRARRAEVLTMVLPIKLLSKNTRDRLHWTQRNALRIAYGDIISIKYPRKRPTHDYRQLVTITRLMGPRERDWDTQNIGAGTAGVELLDAFTHLGWWVDDSPRYLVPEFRQERHPTIKGPAALVTIQAAL